MWEGAVLDLQASTNPLMEVQVGERSVAAQEGTPLQN